MAANKDHPVLVIGGGISGITCAVELDRVGVPVVLIEQEADLGGLAAHLCCKATEACNKCFSCVADRMLRELDDHPGIRRLTGAEIGDVTGGPGAYRVSFRTDGNVSAMNAAAIVVAAGVDPYDATGKGEYAYGVAANVVTARDLEELLRQRGTLRRPSDGREARNIAFIQCVGSRDESIGNLYCSQVCCAYALRLIRQIRHASPHVNAAFLYMDIQPAGACFSGFLTACRADPGIRFIRTLPSRVYHSPTTGDLRVRMADPRQGSIVEETFDTVVLSVGMVLSAKTKALAKLLSLGLNEEGFIAVPPAERGIFVTGACAGPKDIDRSITQAKATAAMVHRYGEGG
jgi:heterodisulfide reductase subunit A2